MIKVHWLVEVMAKTYNLFVKQKGTTTALKQPKEVACYSRTADEEYLIGSDQNLNYYYLPDAELDNRLDLSAGVGKMRDSAKDFKDPNTLKGLLASVQAYEAKKNKRVKADIITFRGIIRRLISAAFDSPKFNKVDLRVVAFDGQLFIKDVSSKEEELRMTTESRNAWYTGYKFETIATLAQPLPYVDRATLEKRPKKLVNTGDEFITVVRTGVGSSKLILGAEVDCVFDFKEEGKDNLKHYAELKCSAMISTPADARKFEKKIFRTWLQCFLVGIPRIIYGFRDDNCILKTVEEFATEEVPLILKSNNPALSTACLDAVKWYGTLVEWLRNSIPTDDTATIKPYRLVYENNHLRLTEIEDTEGEYDAIVNGEAVITEEFKQWRMSLPN